MSPTPFGYRICNGIAVVDEPTAKKIRRMYQNYLEGLSLEQAARKAGIKVYHGTAKKLLSNKHYLGDDFYPAIIDAQTFNAVMMEQKRRAIALNRLNRSKPLIHKTAPTKFHWGEIKEYYEDPAQQAEALYRLIESEETPWQM